MAFARRIQNPEGLYFITFATVQWVDVFTRHTYVDIVLESLKYCQNEKGLRIHAWCIMSNHLHLMISTKMNHHPSDVLRDFKKFTSKQIIAAIEDKEQPESRRGWMLWLFKKAGEDNAKNTNYQFWQQENHPIELISNKFIDQKLAYIHENPVKAGLVDEPWEYRFSSARDYINNQKGLLEVDRTADAVDMRLQNFKRFAGLVGPLQTAFYVQYAVFCRTLRTTGDIVAEGAGTNPNFIWSDAKLGNGSFSKNQKMLVEMIKTGNFEVDIVRDAGINLGSGVFRNKITFSQINVVNSNSKEVAGPITKIWP